MKVLQNQLERLNRAEVSGKLATALEIEIYWFHSMKNGDAAFFQSRSMHRHRFFELHFIFDGNITYKTEERRIELSGGEFVLFAPEQAHKIEACDKKLIKCSVAFTVSKNEALYDSLIFKSGYAEMIGENVYDAISYISNLANFESPYNSLLAKNKVFEIIHGIVGEISAKKRRELTSSIFSTGDIRIFKVKQFINDNPNVFISCEDMADYCDLSVKQLNRLFIKYEGCSLLSYIHNVKVEEAKKLLKNTELPLRVISDDLGFSSVYYFSKFFLKHEGVTPGEYRKKGERVLHSAHQDRV